MSPQTGAVPYRWYTGHDINAFFAFFLDCVVNLFVLSALLASFGFPMDIIRGNILPGAIMGILIGNGLYMGLTYYQAKKTGNHNLTALPLGLDMPTTVGITIGVLGPLFLMIKAETGNVDLAAHTAWNVGMASIIWMGLIKAVLSFFGRFLQNAIPVAALLGTMFGIAVVWLGANAILGVFENPVIGLVALGIMVYSLIGGNSLPFRIPGAVLAIVLSTVIYYAMGTTGMLTLIGSDFVMPSPEYSGASFPGFTLSGLDELFGLSLNYMAITAPFALLIAASSVNISTAAKLTGDDYDPRQVIWIDSTATMISAFFGNVVQTTPYFGHTTYKRMGGRIGYSLGVVTVLVVGGFLGFIGMLIDLIPSPAIKPILIVVACDIVRLTFQSTPRDHAPAVAFAIIPAILSFAFVKMDIMLGQVSAGLAKVQAGMEATSIAVVDAAQFQIINMVSNETWSEYLLLGSLSRGYILTGLLWGSFVAFLIDRKANNAAITLLVAAVFTLYGIIHSVSPDGALYLPWELFSGAITGMSAEALTIPFEIAVAYVLLALVGLMMVGFSNKNGEDAE